MIAQVQKYAEVAFVLGVTGCAMIWPPLALLFAAIYFIALAALVWEVDRRTPAETEAPK